MMSLAMKSLLVLAIAGTCYGNPHQGRDHGVGHGHHDHGAKGHGTKNGHGHGEVAVPVTTYTEECPHGYDEDGHQCIKIDRTPALQKCPPGSVQSGISSGKHHGKKGGASEIVCRVVKTAPVETICPLGYEKNGEACTKVEVAEEEINCPSGYEMLDGDCVKEEAFAPQQQCPAGSTKSHKHKEVQCLVAEHENPDYSCPDGFELKGTHCLREIASEAVVECPTGYVLTEDAQCLKHSESHAKKSCPHGYHMKTSQDGNKVCEKSEHSPPEEVCEEDYQLMAGMCWRKVAANFLQKCPNGFEQTSKGCAATSSYPITRTCPTGTHSHRKNHGHGNKHSMECTRVHIETVESICPEGYTKQPGSDHCMLEESAEEEISCPSGYEMVGEECLKVESISMLKKCPPNTKHDKNACISTDTAPMEHKCPDGTQQLGSDCVTSETAEKSAKCPPGYSMSHQTGPDGGALCEQCEDHAHHKSTGACSYVPAHLVCPDGFTKSLHGGSKTECLKETKHQPEWYCPEGFESTQSGNYLSAASRNRHGSYRHGGHGHNGHKSTESVDLSRSCIKEILHEFEHYCPPGFEQNSDGSCSKEHKHLIHRACPSGFNHGHHGGKHSSSHGHGGSCTRLSMKVATPNCPDGFSLQGNSCIKHTTELPTESCPHGSELIGDECVIVKEAALENYCPPGFTRSSKAGYDCVKKESTRPSHVCSGDYELQGSKCIKHLESEIEETCHDGSEPQDGICIKVSEVAPHEKCPEGFEKSYGEHECLKREVQTPEQSCPEGFEQEGTTCVSTSTIEPEIECSAGAVLSDDGKSCILVKTLGVQRSCPSGYSKHGHHGAKASTHDGCSKMDHAASTKVCPEGFTLSESSSRIRGSSSIATCTATEVLMPEFYCAAGQLIGDSCEHSTSVPKQRIAHTTIAKKTKGKY